MIAISRKKFRAILALAGCLSVAAIPGVRGSYDAPHFDEQLFQVDALSLDDRDRDQIASTLAALVLNFSDDRRVDDDLREKALAIALRLEPLNGSARTAHAALLKGDALQTVDYLTSLGSITEALWRHAENMAGPEAEPEDHILAPYLMEIALLIAPTSAPDRILAYGKAAKKNPLEWNRLVNSQGSAYDSNRRAELLLREAANLAAGRPPAQSDAKGNQNSGNPSNNGTMTAKADGPPNGKGKGKAKGNGGTPAAADISEIKQEKVSLRFVAHNDDSQVFAGEASLNVREPGQDERSLFGLFLGGEKGDRQSFELRLGYDRDGPVIGNFNGAEDLVRPEYPNWPTNRIAEYTFKAAGNTQPRRVDFSLTAPLLLEAAFSGTEIFPDLAVSGTLADGGAIELPGPAAPVAKAAKAGGNSGVKVLLIPESGGASLSDAVTAGDLSVLVKPQVIGFKDFAGARALVFGPRPDALRDAIAQFDEVQNLTAQGMSLDEISKYPSVHERLTKVLELWPGHLSAKIMLAYGTAPVDMHLSIEGSLRQFDKVVEPVAKYYTDSTFGGGTVVGAADKLIDEARTTLRGLRPTVNPEARNCLNSAEKLVEAFAAYFSLSNKGSSRAAQLRRDMQEAVNGLNDERTKLGATSKISL